MRPPATQQSTRTVADLTVADIVDRVTHTDLHDLLGSSSYGAPAFLWADLETTGLDENTDEIIEVACILTNNRLEELDRYQAVIRPSEAALTALMSNPYLVKMHSDNHLLEAVVGPSTRALSVVEADIIDMLTRHGITPDGRPLSVCGSGVANFDIPFLRRHTPKLAMYMTYYSACDIGVFRRSFGAWFNEPLVSINDAKTHRAMDDIVCHLEEARAYQALFQQVYAPNLTELLTASTDPATLGGVDPLLSALDALQSMTSPADELAPEFELGTDAMRLLAGSLHLNLRLLGDIANDNDVPELLNQIRDQVIDEETGSR